VIHYFNSFIPILKGSFNPLPEGTKVSVIMVPNPIHYLFIFLGIIFGLMAVIGCDGGDIAGFNKQKYPQIIILSLFRFLLAVANL
jgi:hypothetical protein